MDFINGALTKEKQEAEKWFMDYFKKWGDEKYGKDSHWDLDHGFIFHPDIETKYGDVADYQEEFLDFFFGLLSLAGSEDDPMAEELFGKAIKTVSIQEILRISADRALQQLNHSKATEYEIFYLDKYPVYANGTIYVFMPKSYSIKNGVHVAYKADGLQLFQRKDFTSYDTTKSNTGEDSTGSC